jgi:glycosyltransferase involved in cell wall biosynthesis
MSEQPSKSGADIDALWTGDGPLISVIMPAYNAEKHIARALESIRAQTYPNVEIIVVDDGSTDATEDVVRRTAPNARYMKIINSGPAAARNEGNLHAKGKYLAFLDADDLWHPRKLELQVAYLERNPAIGVVFCMWCETLPNETNIDWRKKQRFKEPLSLAIMAEKSGWLYPDLLLDTMIHTSSVVLRKALFDELGGFNRALTIGEDYDLWIRLSRITEIHKLRATLSAYEQRVDSITRTPQASPFGATVIRRNLSKWGRQGPDGRRANWFAVRRRISQSFRNYGATHLKFGNQGTAIRSTLNALFYDPISSSNWRSLVKAVVNYQNGTARKTASGTAKQ